MTRQYAANLEIILSKRVHQTASKNIILLMMNYKLHCLFFTRGKGLLVRQSTLLVARLLKTI